MSLCLIGQKIIIDAAILKLEERCQIELIFLFIRISIVKNVNVSKQFYKTMLCTKVIEHDSVDKSLINWERFQHKILNVGKEYRCKIQHHSCGLYQRCASIFLKVNGQKNSMNKKSCCTNVLKLQSLVAQARHCLFGKELDTKNIVQASRYLIGKYLSIKFLISKKNNVERINFIHVVSIRGMREFF